MPSRKSYNRFFIILQEDQKGYGLDLSKTPSGYAKLEMRNDRAKASFYVQDIKKQNGPYYMVLIALGNNGSRELINLGQINIDEYGKADVSNEYDVNNIAGTNIGMDKIQGAGICRINGTKINPVMAGFICGEELKNWPTYPLAKCNMKNSNIKDDLVKDNITKVKNEIKTEIKPEVVKENVEINEKNDSKSIIESNLDCNDKNEAKEHKEVKKENLLREDKDDNDKVNSSDDNCERVETENFNNDKLEESDVDNIQDFDEYENQIERLKEYRKKHSKEKKYNNEYKNSDECECNKDKYSSKADNDICANIAEKDGYLKGPMGEFFKSVVNGLEKIGPKEGIKNCFWYKAHVKNLESMYCVYDYNKYSVVFYPMICYYPYIAKTKSFMIGYKCDDDGNLKYIIYAIAGTKDIIDQPYEGKTGFVTFMSEDNTDMGYWLMYYDIKRNAVVVPVKRR